MVFACCCVSDGASSSGCIGAGSSRLATDVGKDAMREDIGEAGHLGDRMKESSSGSFFPALRAYSARSQGSDSPPTASASSREGSPKRHSPAMEPRAEHEGDAKAAGAAKEQEKARLQAVVTDFKRAAVEGIPVDVIDPETLSIARHVFSLDKLLYTLTLRPCSIDREETYESDVTHASSSSRGTRPEVRTFDMKDLRHIFKDPEVVHRSPKLSAYGLRCIGFDVAQGSKATICIFLHFAAETERDKFYTCLKILHMSASILRGEAPGGQDRASSAIAGQADEALPATNGSRCTGT